MIMETKERGKGGKVEKKGETEGRREDNSKEYLFLY